MSTLISILPTDVLSALSAVTDATGEGATQPKLNLLRLPCPRTGHPSLFLPVNTRHDVSTILELQRVSPNASRSWFNGGEVLSDGTMLLMTPVDPTFLLVPLLKVASPQDGSLGNFRTIDDILDHASVQIAEMSDGDTGTSELLIRRDILELSRLPCIQDAMRRICDTKDIASDFVVFRYSHARMLDYLVKKANRLADGNFIKNSRTLERELAKDGLMDDGKEELLRSGRLKLACDLVSQYITPDIHQELLGKFDFSVLDTYRSALEREDSAMLQTTGNDYTAQVSQTTEEQNGKKRKATGQESMGVTKLKKANIKGMSKLSSFFQKKS